MAQDWFDTATSGASQPVPSGGGVVIRNPWKAREEARKDEDQGFERERIRIAQEANDRAAAATTAQIANMNKPPVGYRWGPPDAQGNPTMQIIPGGPADKSTQSAMTSAQRIELESKRGTLRNLASGISQLRKQYEDNFKGRSLGEYLPAVVNPANGVFNDTSGSLSAYVAAALGLSGQQFNTPAEQQLFIGSILPRAGDTDAQIENKLNRLDDLIRNADETSAGQLGIKAEGFGAPSPGNAGDSLPGGTGGGSPGPYQNDPSGNRTFLTERDKAFAEESSALFKQPGSTRADFDALAAKYNAQPFGPDLDAALQNRTAATAFAPNPTGFEEAGLTAGIANTLPSSVGSYAIGAGNALTAGQLGNIAQLTGSSEGGTDVALNMAQDNAIPYFLGGLTGGGIGTALTGVGLSGLSRYAANPTVASLLANPMTADVAFGAATGAAEAEDPLYGAVGGGLTALGGSWLGGKIGQRFGGSRVDDPLKPGERAVMNAMERGTGISVEEALQQGQDLGIPLTLADVSPEVATLTGAAIRRNPAVAGQARDFLSRRNQGQIDRFRGAVARDLGPVTNIPERSDDLIKQAQSAAAPLYDAAYSTPGATVLDVADILARPSGRSALGKAGRLAAEEGRDPLALGFQFDDVGNAVGIEAPSWQTLDYVKRGLDDVVQGNRSANMGRLDTEGRAVNDTLQNLLSRMDEMNPDYAAARASYAGPMQERAALEAGRDAIRTNPDQLVHDVANIPAPRLDQWRLGMQSGLAGQAENLSNSTNPFRILNTPAMERRLEILYPEQGDDVARLLLQRDLENRMAGTSNFLAGNSATAERAIADQAFADEGLLRPIIEGGIETAVSGAPVMTVGRRLGGQWLRDRATLGTGQRAMQRAEEIAPLALNPDPAATVAEILAMQARQAEYQAAVEAAKASAGRRGGHLGAAGVIATDPYWMGN